MTTLSSHLQHAHHRKSCANICGHNVSLGVFIKPYDGLDLINKLKLEPNATVSCGSTDHTYRIKKQLIIHTIASLLRAYTLQNTATHQNMASLSFKTAILQNYCYPTTLRIQKCTDFVGYL